MSAMADVRVNRGSAWMIVAGLTEPDSGRVEVHSSATLGYLEQHPEFEPGRTVWEEASAALANIADLARHSEEIALAIVAEIQTTFSEGAGNSLRDRKAPIHLAKDLAPALP